MKNLTRNSSARIKSANAIVAATATTLIHLEVIGPVALENQELIVQNLTKLINMLTLTPVRIKILIKLTLT